MIKLRAVYDLDDLTAVLNLKRLIVPMSRLMGALPSLKQKDKRTKVLRCPSVIHDESMNIFIAAGRPLQVPSPKLPFIVLRVTRSLVASGSED